jgi:hypothetical protein
VFTSIFEGNTRQPRDLAIYEALTEAGVLTAELYDRTDWVSLLGLASTDEAPLSSRNFMGLAACLATYGAFGAIFNAQPAPAAEMAAKQFQRSLMQKGGSTQPHDGADFY